MTDEDLRGHGAPPNAVRPIEEAGDESA